LATDRAADPAQEQRYNTTLGGKVTRAHGWEVSWQQMNRDPAVDLVGLADTVVAINCRKLQSRANTPEQARQVVLFRR
jgi:hypothetical protein